MMKAPPHDAWATSSEARHNAEDTTTQQAVVNLLKDPASFKTTDLGD